jgi:predicted amidohydrolase YtcJ
MAPVSREGEKLMRRLLLSASCLLACCGSPEPAEVIFENGNFITLDPATPQAEAVAVREERILAVGSREEIEKYRGDQTEVVDLEGATVVPGLIDAHEHFPDIGKRLRQVFLDETRSASEALEIVKRELERIPPGEWLVGQGWHTVSWNGSDYPGEEELTRISPDNPVFLVGMASHAAWVNAKALELAGITRDTPDPPGGQILKRKDTGAPSGILLEEAQDLVARLLPSETREIRKEAIRRSVETALRFGLTGMHDAGVDSDIVGIYKELVAEGAFPFRLYVMLDVPDAGDVLDSYLEHPPEIGLGGNRLTIRCFKAYADGALGARGAALLEPYSDDASATGLIQNSEDELVRLIEKAGSKGYQVAIHAIGDRGNRNTLNAVERARKELPGKDPRVRIEHAQILSPSDIPRFASLSVIASMQPIHATMDMGFAETRVGPERIRGGYAWRSLLSSGARVAAGSDTPAFPVAYNNPLWGIHAAVTRQDSMGKPEGGWYPDEKVSRLDALKMYTLHPAYAAFEEEIKGSISPGKLADLTVLSKDIFTIPEAEIRNTEVVMTVLGGKVVYRRPES